MEDGSVAGHCLATVPNCCIQMVNPFVGEGLGIEMWLLHSSLAN